MSYYDIDAILTDNQKVPCTFNLTLPQLGYLDSTPGRPLPSGTKVDLPLWLAERLAVSQLTPSTSLITLDLPASLSPRVMNALKADPKSVDLRSLAANFYGLAERILELFEEEEVCDVLLESWRVRAAEVGDHAVSSGKGGGGVGGGEGVEFLRGLDEKERELFRSAHDSSKAMRVWMGEMKKR
ncbi:putative GINS complex subunit Psf3 [Hyaloscypha variabilis F]|uniref:DNA replication complex GINS protein PSF3 n=1 Tax=Hyaloscypha variabilis (strain UAMH 11265 / GT02V1 / F) TaxID=1149755 RepID=A0A2J6R944_HYAVF|nr:putative GINS complex subunit Psf3 [Hyaloscypha variabilis F]